MQYEVGKNNTSCMFQSEKQVTKGFRTQAGLTQALSESRCHKWGKRKVVLILPKSGQLSKITPTRH